MFNPYFWFFAVFALLITPVTAHTGLRFERELYWQIQIQLAGLPVISRKREKKGTEKTQETRLMVESLFSPERKLARALWRDGEFSKLVRVFHWEALWMNVRISMNDAAGTALGYALVRTLLETLCRCGALPAHTGGRVTADFDSRGTLAELHGIFSARLGRVALAGARLGLAALRAHARLAMEEKKYAASH